jgi:7-cyano-7-deazaguanine synthase
MTKVDGVAVISGGLDSVTMAYHLVALGLRPRLVSFDYGQRHRKELMYAERAAYDLDLDWNLIDLSSLTSLFTSSALTFGKDVPEGHYAEDNMAVTVVPNRNMIMLSIAAGIAVNDELKYVAAGMHAGDHAQYPDCRPEFIDSLTQTLREANRGFIRRDFQVLTPWIFKTKDDIAHEAWSHNVPLDMTWSCYRGGKNHCGRCGTCVERLEAIASVEEAPEDWDKTVYEDGEFWKAAVAEFKASK